MVPLPFNHNCPFFPSNMTSPSPALEGEGGKVGVTLERLSGNHSCASALEAESQVKGLDFVLFNPLPSLHPVSINLDLSARAKHSSSVIHAPWMHISTFVCNPIQYP